jgi:catechol 2,3-dioxygenase-like lactoylglutathione lyase family enzyme
MSLLDNISALRIFVRDLDSARRFYGGALELRETGTGTSWITFELGDVDIVVEAVPPDDPEGNALVGRFLAVSFSVGGKIDEAYRRLSAKGVPFEGAPERQNWGGTLAFARDPDGNVLTLVG